MKKAPIDSIVENLMETTRELKIRYKNNDATQVPTYMFGTAHQIKTWLLHRQYDQFISETFKK